MCLFLKSSRDSRPPKDMEKRKRSGYLRYPEQPNTMEEALSLSSAPYETLNDAYLGNKNYIVGSNQCPIIESMAERCRGVDLISGDINQELLPLCGVHQICYLCVSENRMPESSMVNYSLPIAFPFPGSLAGSLRLSVLGGGG